MNVEPMSINIEGLEKRYGTTVALHNLTLNTGTDWRCLGVLGRNGAGKSTLLRILVGLLSADGGKLQISMRGSMWSHADPDLATYLAEKISLLVPSLSGWQFLRLYDDLNRIRGIGVHADLRQHLIQTLDLSEHLPKPIYKMSKGNQRKTEVVAAISADVPLVIADELTEGLDVPSRLDLESLLANRFEFARRFIISSHDLSFISAVCDIVAIIDHGQCVDLCNVNDDKTAFKDRVARAFQMK